MVNQLSKVVHKIFFLIQYNKQNFWLDTSTPHVRALMLIETLQAVWFINNQTPINPHTHFAQ